MGEITSFQYVLFPTPQPPTSVTSFRGWKAQPRFQMERGSLQQENIFMWTDLLGHPIFVSSSFSFETLLRHEGLSFNTRLKLVFLKSPFPVRSPAGCFTNIVSLVFMIPLPGSVILPSLGMRKVQVEKHKH